jgi:hypothetical protein
MLTILRLIDVTLMKRKMKDTQKRKIKNGCLYPTAVEWERGGFLEILEKP